MTARRRALLAAVGGAALWPAGRVRAAEPALRLGIAPFLSPAALLATFRPLREQFAAALGQPVQAYTARDFRALVQAMRDGDYDLGLVPAHLARLAVREWGWLPLAATVQTTPVRLLVRGGDTAATVASLAGRRIGMLDPLSLTSAVAVVWLAQQSLPAEVVAQRSINGALVALERGDLAAVVAAESQRRSLPPQTPTGQRVLATLGDIPGPQFVARPGVAPAEQARWQAALLAFRPDPARPATVANSRLTPLTEALMARVDAQADVLKRQLGTG